jgi:hypothetical protein
MAESRPISTLPIARALVDQLTSCGFRTVEELRGLKPIDLAKELNVRVEISYEILKSAKFESPENEKPCLTAKDLVMKKLRSPPIVTFCRSLDTILGGGVTPGQIVSDRAFKSSRNLKNNRTDLKLTCIYCFYRRSFVGLQELARPR